jgi:hypothetical protein
MDARDLADYGGPKVDAKPVQNPESELTAGEYNREAEDVAQLTCCKVQAVVRFNTTAVAAPVVYATAAVQHRSLWGNGDAQKPTVTKTATGRYTIAYPATFTDSLGIVETLNFLGATVEIISATAGDVVQGRPLTVTSSGGTFVIHSPHGTDADVGDVGAAVLTVVVTFY